MLAGDHARIDVEMPDGSVKRYDSLGEVFPIVMGLIDPLCLLNNVLIPARTVARYEIGP